MGPLNTLIHIFFNVLIGTAMILGSLAARWLTRDSLVSQDPTDLAERLTWWIIDGVCAAGVLAGLLMATFGVPGNPTA